VRAFDGAVERDERLVDGAIVLPAAGKRSFWLNGSAWELPTYDNFDVFLRRLGRKGEVSKDQAVEATLLGRPTDLSLRSLQRRIRQTTGLTQVAIKQIARAERAVALLESGATISSMSWSVSGMPISRISLARCGGSSAKRRKKF
jgi:hypothetical protein